LLTIAVPSEAPGGLDALISEHFGHCELFTLVEVDDGRIGKVTTLPNLAHEHGGCMGPVTLLKENGVEAMVAGGMGARPLAGFQQVGIAVYFKEEATTVREAVEGVLAGRYHEFGERHTCGGHGGSCGGHHAAPELEPVAGPAESGRVVRLTYELSELGKDEVIDRAEEVRYLHGEGQIVPGLERAVEGHVAGDSFEVTLRPEQGFGMPDPEKVLEVEMDRMPDGVKPGDVVHTQTPDGRLLALTVLSTDGDRATLDANHPLAGKTLLFKVKVIEVLRPKG
jgi:FKBP-type peptidyl-prolyl cis-trans isomerase 2/predicted Fe-Mo cluster-binding NifX family protein